MPRILGPCLTHAKEARDHEDVPKLGVAQIFARLTRCVLLGGPGVVGVSTCVSMCAPGRSPFDLPSSICTLGLLGTIPPTLSFFFFFIKHYSLLL